MVEVAIGWPEVSNCDALHEIGVVPVALWHETVTSEAATGSPAHEPADDTPRVAVMFLPLARGTVKPTVTEAVAEAASGSVDANVGDPLMEVIVGAAKKKK